MKDTERIKTRIRVGSVVNTKFREMEDNTREGTIRSTRKYVVEFSRVWRVGGSYYFNLNMGIRIRRVLFQFRIGRIQDILRNKSSI